MNPLRNMRRPPSVPRPAGWALAIRHCTSIKYTCVRWTASPRNIGTPIRTGNRVNSSTRSGETPYCAGRRRTAARAELAAAIPHSERYGRGRKPPELLAWPGQAVDGGMPDGCDGPRVGEQQEVQLDELAPLALEQALDLPTRLEPLAHMGRAQVPAVALHVDPRTHAHVAA